MLKKVVRCSLGGAAALPSKVARPSLTLARHRLDLEVPFLLGRREGCCVVISFCESHSQHAHDLSEALSPTAPSFLGFNVRSRSNRARLPDGRVEQAAVEGEPLSLLD